MNRDDRFDAIAREAHAHALDALSPHTRVQLQLRRRAAPATPRFRGYALPLAAACAIAALAIGWPLRRPDIATGVAPAAIPVAAADEDSPTLALDENPELYEWLASSDAAALAME